MNKKTTKDIGNSDHFFYSSSPEINEIIKPLTDFFGLSSFVYQKNFLDGSEIRLSNQPKWIHHFYANKLYQKSVFETHPQRFEKTHIIWAALPQHKGVLKEAREFNIDHGITFVEPCSDGCEFFFIGTTSDKPEVMAHYLNNIDILERFLVYFRDKAAPLIKEAHQHRLTIPNKFIEAPQTNLIGNFDRSAFLQAINIKHPFTPREIACIELLLKGYTLKMIAQELDISVRTVETHLDHIKNKVGVSSKAALVKYLHTNSTLKCD